MDVAFGVIWKAFESAAAGWQVLIILILLIVKACAILGIKNLADVYKIWKNKGKPTFIPKKQRAMIVKASDLNHHPLFFTMTHLINHRVKMMNFGDDERNKIFRTLLEVQIKSVCKHSKKIIDENDITAIDKVTFKSLIFKAFADSIDAYNLEMKERFGADVYGIVMQHSTKGYNNWHEPVLVYTSNLVDDICDSDLYNTNVEKMYAIFNAYNSAIDATLVNVEKTFHGFNGELNEILHDRFSI